MTKVRKDISIDEEIADEIDKDKDCKGKVSKICNEALKRYFSPNSAELKKRIEEENQRHELKITELTTFLHIRREKENRKPEERADEKRKTELLNKYRERYQETSKKYKRTSNYLDDPELYLVNWLNIINNELRLDSYQTITKQEFLNYISKNNSPKKWT